jgi:chromate transporter
VSRAEPNHPPSLREAFWVWLRVAALSFGGPAGQIGVIHRILVDEKKWISERRFLHALNYCMVLPGPEAMQLAAYTGWLLNGVRGGILAGGLFVLPGFLSILALSTLYVTYGDATLVEALFYGLRVAVLAVVLFAVYRLGARSLRSVPLILIAIAAFVAIFFLNIPFPFLILAAAGLGLLGHRFLPDAFRAPGHPGDGTEEGTEMPRYSAAARAPATARRALRTAATWLAIWLVPLVVVALLLGVGHAISVQALFFSVVALVTFGGAYAVLAYVAQQAVEVYAWLLPGEMVDGLGMAETTPGPLIQVTQFVGFLGAYRDPGALDPLAAAVLASIVVTWAVFVPSFLFIFTGAPYIESLRGRPRIGAALSAITAAVVGVILNLAVFFGLHVLFARVDEVRVGVLRAFRPDLASIDLVALGLFLAAFLMLLHRRAKLLPVLLGTAAAGFVLRMAFG